MRHYLGLIAIFVGGCLILTRLGLWQLDRAEQKRERHREFTTAFEQKPIAFDIIALRDAPASTWRRTRVQGTFSKRLILLDNRTQHGRSGYDVLSPFETRTGRTLLVERGWIPLPPDRRTVPAISAPESVATLEGYLGPEPVAGLAFNQAADVTETLAPDVYRIQRLELDNLRATLGTDLWPTVLYLDAGMPGALAVERKLPGDGAAKHTAYAVQWFSMAAVLAAIGMWNLKRRQWKPS
tara:strand:+ start:925 stop:1641 length:717 start_codon:yes stop_codon:yes gene_type:complete